MLPVGVVMDPGIGDLMPCAARYAERLSEVRGLYGAEKARDALLAVPNPKFAS